MKKDEENINNLIIEDPVSIDMNELDQFLCYMKLREELLTKLSSLGVKNLKTILSLDDSSLNKILTSVPENQGKILIKNFNLLADQYESSESINISELPIDLGGVSLTKETIITGFKMKNKTQSHTLSYQQNLEKNSKPDKIFVSFLSNKNIGRLSNLELFKNMKHLYLSDNKLQRISNLENLVNLNILDLKGNYIRRIEGLDNLINLQTLNLEQNLIEALENLTNNINIVTLNVSQQTLPKDKIFLIDDKTLPIDSLVQTINLENNQINDVRNLRVFKYTQTLKLKNNKIEELNYILEAVKEMPFLENLNFINNPLKDSNKTSRDIIIIYGQKLTEINEKNVTNNERSFLNSFFSRRSNNKGKTKIKQDNLDLEIVKIDSSNKQESFPNVKNFKYYNYK
jgi:hypothetical protein